MSVFLSGYAMAAAPWLHASDTVTIDAPASKVTCVKSVMPSIVPVELPELASDRTYTATGDDRVCEQIVHLGPNRLFGIATGPVTGHDSVLEAATGPIVLFLNSGNDWHVGPGRSWVELARMAWPERLARW